eukprot:TRINITY_DN599_c0_g1_i2.p1 TRINITY_DN599_c0_g1~~TRINITY_DN599_c0_g1_i2.p1  ORF type:complete len:474 (+),score=68.35 TRINITY_DN599_c0_g1_i2:883-2304(+)
MTLRLLFQLRELLRKLLPRLLFRNQTIQSNSIAFFFLAKRQILLKCCFDSEGQTEHLAMKMAVLTTHLMNSRKTKQPCYMRYYPYAVGYAISACYKKMFPGSTAVRTAKFTEDVLRIASGLWNGMEMNRASHRHICQLAGIDAFKGERPSSAHSMQSADGDIEPIVEFPKKARLRHSVSRLLPVLQVEGPSDAAGAFFMTVGPQSAPLSPRTRPLSRGSQLSLKSDTQEVDDGGWAGLLGDPDTVALKNARIRMIRAEKVKRERTHNVQKFDAFALSPLMSRCLHRVPLTGHPKQVLHRTMRPDGAPGLYGTQYGYLGLDNKDPKLYARLYQRIGNPVDHAYYERLSSMTKKAVKACHDQLHYETEKLNHLEDVVMAQSRRMMKGRVAGYDEMMKPRELEANEEGKKMTRHVIPTVAGQVRGLLDPTIKAMLSEPMRRPSYWNAMRTVSPLNEISATIGTLRKRNLQSVWDHV